MAASRKRRKKNAKKKQNVGSSSTTKRQASFTYKNGVQGQDRWIRKSGTTKSKVRGHWMRRQGKSISPRLWNDTLTSILQKYGFHRLKSEPTIYLEKTTKEQARNFILLGCYVDDLICCGANEGEVT